MRSGPEWATVARQAAPAIALLAEQRTRLERASTTGFPEQQAAARRYLVKVRGALADLRVAPASWSHWAGVAGENGWAPAIDSVCRHAERPATVRFLRRHPEGFIIDNEDLAA